MSSYSAKPFPFVYQCRCGAVEVVTYADATSAAPEAPAAEVAADTALVKAYGWGRPRPNSRCSLCKDSGH